MHVVVLGGGAAGVLAAITAAQAGARVTVLERNVKPLKKLGITGNGRGNILNAGVPEYYGDTAFALDVLNHCGYEELSRFFASIGVPLRQEDDGRIYPASLQASAVQEALLLRARQLGIVFRCLVRVEQITPLPHGFALEGQQITGIDPKQAAEEAFSMQADTVIVACGGAAYPAHGTDGSAYRLLEALGHPCTTLKPALCALHIPKKRLQGLKGQRVRAKLCLKDAQGKPVHESRGEALFADDAVSGIAAMQQARFVQGGMTLCLDLRDELNMHGPVLPFIQSLAQARIGQPVAELLTGAFSKPVSRFILREAGVKDISVSMKQLTDQVLKTIAQTIESVCLPLTGTRGFESAQVTAGGIETKDFDAATMESRLVPGLYAAGEILNVDGECGGFNLMFAFASGMLAGRAAAE